MSAFCQEESAIMTAEIQNKVRGFIQENFLFQDPGAVLADTDSLLDGGVIDSAGVLSLVIFLEESFGIQVADEEVVPDNLDSIAKLTAYVQRKKAEEN